MFDLTQFYLFELVVMRITGFVALTPLLGRNNVPGIVKAGFTLVLSYFVMGIVGEGPEAPQSTTALILTLLLELGVGLVVREGGASGGDDALALIIAKVSGCRIAKAYLITDLTVLLLSLSYIPWQRIAYSLVTVTLSSFLIDKIQNFRVSRRETA